MKTIRLDPENAGEAGRWYAGAVQFPQSINVPGSWQAQGVGEPSGNLRHHYAGVAWYRRTVGVPGAWRDQVVRLRIGGVHRRAKVFVNGTAVVANGKPTNALPGQVLRGPGYKPGTP